MPALLGTATASYRVGQAAVQKIYLGSSVVFDGDEPGDTTQTPPPDANGVPTPFGPTASVSGTNFLLKWRLSGSRRAAVNSYVFKRSYDGGNSWVDFAVGNTLASTDTGAERRVTATFSLSSLPAGAHQFRIAAAIDAAQGAFSEPTPTLAKPSALTTPTGLTISNSGTASAPRRTLSWNASTGTAGIPIEYEVQHSTSGGDQWTTFATDIAATSVTLFDPNGRYVANPATGQLASTQYLNNVQCGIEYIFRVRASYSPTYRPVQELYGDSPPVSEWSANSTATTVTTTEPPYAFVYAEPFPQGVLLVPEIGIGWDTRGATITRIDFYLTTTVGVWPNTPTAVWDNPQTEYLGGGYRFFQGGLTPRTQYWVAAVATNATGTGAFNPAYIGTNSARDFKPLPAGASPVVDLTPTPLAAGALYTYDNSQTYAYPATRRAVRLDWSSAPYASYTPLFEIQSILQATDGTTTTGTRVYEEWKSFLPSPASRLNNKTGNVVDTLLPNATYQFRVREVRGLSVGPWKYTGFVLTAS